MNLAVRAEGLRKRFGKHEALRGVDLAVEPGTVCGLLGPNGAGKTTVVRVLTTLLRPDAGTAVVAGHDIRREPDAVRYRIGVSGQYAAVDELLTGRANLIMFGRLYGLSTRQAKQRADALLERFRLTEYADRKVKTYSGGTRRRLDVVASLLVAPPVLFLDEPTTGLDPRSRLAMWAAIGELVAEGTTVLLTTQYLDEADRLADQVVVLDHGEVVAAGPPAKLKVSIGGERLDVVVRDVERFADAAHAMEAAIGFPPELTLDERRLTAPVADGTSSLVATVRALDAAGVAVEDIALRHPTLDEVFLALT